MCLGVASLQGSHPKARAVHLQNTGISSALTHGWWISRPLWLGLPKLTLPEASASLTRLMEDTGKLSSTSPTISPCASSGSAPAAPRLEAPEPGSCGAATSHSHTQA
jgi:hypothetical protein